MIYKTIETVIGNFPHEYQLMLEEISTVRKFEKDEDILQQGKYCNNLWFINQGAVKAFESIDGNERVTYFFLDSMFFTNYYCWVTSDKSDITFRAVEESEIIVIDYPKLEVLCTRHHIFDTIGRKMAERIPLWPYHSAIAVKRIISIILPNTALANLQSAIFQQPRVNKGRARCQTGNYEE